MSTVMSPPEAPMQSPEVRERRVVMDNVSWETYEGLLAALIDASSPRITYDHGTLEIMSPSRKHEEAKEVIATIADSVALEWGMEFLKLGSTTFRRRDLEQGLEPDSCFYFENVERIRGDRELDLLIDPPPDLVIEVEISSALVNKLPSTLALACQRSA